MLSMCSPGCFSHTLARPSVTCPAARLAAPKALLLLGQDEMMLAAARALADYVSADDIRRGKLYPDISELRAVSATVRAPCMHEAPCQSDAELREACAPPHNCVKAPLLHFSSVL